MPMRMLARTRLKGHPATTAHRFWNSASPAKSFTHVVRFLTRHEWKAVNVFDGWRLANGLVRTKYARLSDTKLFKIIALECSVSVMRHLFPSFDGPTHASPYFCVQRRHRWWPVAAAFVAGMTCVFALVGPWTYAGGRSTVETPAAGPTTPVSANVRSQSVSAAPSDRGEPAAATEPRTNAAAPPPGAPAAAPADEHPVAPAAIGNTSTAAARAPRASSNAKMLEARRSIASPPMGKTAAAAAAGALPDQAAGMVRIDEEELPDGRRVPVYRRPTIFDSVRTPRTE